VRKRGMSCNRSKVGFAWTFLVAAAITGPTHADPENALTARGVLRSVGEATLASDINSRIISIPFRDGQTFSKGDILLSFDCDKPAAELKVAEAESRGHRATHENSQNLQRMRAAGGLEVAVAKAQWEKAEAAVEVAKVRVGQCRIVAPFSGRVVDVLTHENDTPAANAPLLRIVDHFNIELDLILPSKWLVWMREAAPFSFRIDETGTTVRGRISRVGAAVDPVSQTVKVSGVLLPGAVNTGAVLPGMSGVATFSGSGE